MTQPLISAICCTYGRTQHLRNAIACFLNQTWVNKELIVFNTCPQQTLSVRGNPESVIVHNCTERPPSLGACRHLACGAAKGDLLCVWDDDDLYLPHHLQIFGEAMVEKPDAEWIRMNPVFYAEGWIIKSTIATWANAVAFSKAAYNKIGGYCLDLSVGEDRNLIGRLSENCHGATVELPANQISAIYCWANKVNHISGRGEDVAGRTTAYERSAHELRHRIADGLEPRGEIEIVPEFAHDPVAIRDSFINVSGEESTLNAEAVCFVQLGRYGDIINILPIVHHHAITTGQRPYLMVSREFKSLLDGISYAIPYPVALNYAELNSALEIARGKFKRVIRCQIFGKDHPQDRQTESYNKEAWREAGMLDQFDNKDMRPLFDKRNIKREESVVRKVFRELKKPKLITSLLGGVSSPFPRGKEICSQLRREFRDTHEVIEVSILKLDRIYDLIGILERADIIVSSDTAILHLAGACQTPVIALVNEKPWLGSFPRCNCIARIPYPEANVEQISLAIRMHIASRDQNRVKMIELEPLVPLVRDLTEPTIFHAVERHHEPEIPRKTLAWKSWDYLYAQGVVPCHYWRYARDSKSIRDSRKLPFLKDVLEFAMIQAGDDDIILWTNDDVWLHPDLIHLLRQHVPKHEACTGQRVDFSGPMPPATSPPEAFACLGRRHMGRDLLATTKRWLKTHWNGIPDFILGASDFDLCLACMVREKWGIQSNRQNLEDTYYPAELPCGYVAHQMHQPFWANPRNVDSAPSQIHNRKLFREWAAAHLPGLVFYQGNVI